MELRGFMQSARARKTAAAVALAVPTLALTGCYVTPVGQDTGGNPVYMYSPVPVVPAQNGMGRSYPAVSPSGPMPVALPVKLYPSNDLANQTGVLTGEVTNMMTGKGRFQLNYQGETLSGEATRVEGDSRRGVASAYGSGGSYMSCEYQMRTPQQGAGTCQFSNGAKYQVHIGT